MSQYPTDTSIAAPDRAPDAVSRRAYEIWENEGRPEGCDLKHWLQAEQELGSETSHDENPVAATANPSRNTGTDTQPLQGTRAAQANTRASKRNSGAPFGTERNDSNSASTAGGASAGKRKPSSAPVF